MPGAFQISKIEALMMPPVLLAVATAIAAFAATGFVAILLGALTVASIAVIGFVFPPIAYLNSDDLPEDIGELIK